ncbi:MAG: alpha/beta hydrolase [Dehalococcoidia bacterium]|nr:alpha/beta hydrolase [Dehalococcoidia bacterium]
MGAVDFGLPLHEAARRTGVTISAPIAPKNGYVTSAAGGVKLHYFDWGSDAKHTKLPVVCLHGYAQSAHMWDFSALALAHERRLIALDQRGHGDSGWPADHDYTPQVYQNDIDALLDGLKLDRVVLMGLSMGGRNSLTYTAMHPDRIKALVIVDMGPETARAGANRVRQFTAEQDVLDSFDAFVQRTQRYTPLRVEWQIRGSLSHQLKQLPDGKWTWKSDPYLRDPSLRAPPTPPSPAAAAAATEQNWELWKKIQCPTLIVRGEQTDVLPREVAERMERELQGRATLVQVPRAGHLVPGDNPVGFEQAIKPFFSRIP